MKKYIQRYRVAIAITCLLLGACHKLDLTPHDRETDTEYWNKPESAAYKINKCYQGMNNAEEVLYADSRSEDAYTIDNSSHNTAIVNGSYTTASYYVRYDWG